MKSNPLKKYLLEIADKVDENTTLEDIYEQLSFLNDIAISEKQYKNNETLSHSQLVKESENWF
jgi:hypothetical protein